MNNDVVFIFANSFDSAVECSRLMHLGYRDWIYLHDVDQLRGSDMPNIILYGNVEGHVLFKYIEYEARLRDGTMSRYRSRDKV